MPVSRYVFVFVGRTRVRLFPSSFPLPPALYAAYLLNACFETCETVPSVYGLKMSHFAIALHAPTLMSRPRLHESVLLCVRQRVSETTAATTINIIIVPTARPPDLPTKCTRALTGRASFSYVIHLTDGRIKDRHQSFCTAKWKCQPSVFPCALQTLL